MADIVIKRLKKGKIKVNIKRVVEHHSEDFEVGYAGSGPAELSLNILQHFLPGEQIKCNKGRCSRDAMMLHQPFKWKFITPMDQAGGTIKEEEIKKWIEVELTKMKNQV